jgi:hypothetical protein
VPFLWQLKIVKPIAKNVYFKRGSCGQENTFEESLQGAALLTRGHRPQENIPVVLDD